MNFSTARLKAEADKLIPKVNESEEADEPEYIETRRKLRPETAARIQAEYDKFASRLSPGGGTPWSGITIGPRTFENEGNEWYEIVRRRNPAYWEQPNYFVAAGSMPEWTIIYCKMPRRASQATFRKAIKQIVRDVTGGPVDWRDFIVESIEKQEFEAGTAKGNPAYEIAIDGTWKRIS